MIKHPADNKNELMLTDEVIMDKIYLIRGQKVMLDRDLSELYGVKTKVLKQQVRRNMNRFPEDFMFELTLEEFSNWRSQFVTSKSDKMGLRYTPFAFTEHGVVMLASVLNSERAIQANIRIVRIYNKMREMLMSHKAFFTKLNELEKSVSDHDQKILLIFEYIRQLEQTKQSGERSD
jgi:phage regulator Rha-like protein